MKSRQRADIRLILLFTLLLILAGTFGLAMMTGTDLGSALYQTLLILTTHFYHAVDAPLPAQLLILGLIIGGIILMAYLIKYFVEYIIEGELKGGFSRRRMDRRMQSLTGHYIIAGLGRVGRQVARELSEEGSELVVVEQDPARLELARSQGWATVSGSASEDSVLTKAGIERARGLVVATGSDADNVFITLSARSLAPELFIVARANSLQARDKLEKAGADRIALPHRIGGYHMATMALRPGVVDFLDLIVDSRHRELQVDEILIGPASPLVGKPLSSYLDRSKTGTTVLAINRLGRETIINPAADDLVVGGDRLIIMGTQDQLDQVGRIG